MPLCLWPHGEAATRLGPPLGTSWGRWDAGRVSTSLPGEVTRQILGLGAAITPEMVQGSWALLTPYHEKLGYQAPRVHRDRSYGDFERNRLDIHAPDSSGRQPGAGSPVVLFVHGGGFVGGDKHVPGTPMYDHVGAWAVRHGAVGVTMTYRLAPEHVWPAGARDVAAAVAWTRENIGSYGGDPGRIVIVGHSAGAVHVASYLAGQGGGTLSGISGAALLSGIYDLDMRHRSELEHIYFGDHPADEVSTLPHLVASPVPLLFSIAEHDPHPFHAQALGVASAWYAAHRRMPAMAWVGGHNHISEIASLGVDSGALGVALARFVATVTASEEVA
jgi:acetyl esterase/lipase